jgi:hypothetical protein
MMQNLQHQFKLDSSPTRLKEIGQALARPAKPFGRVIQVGSRSVTNIEIPHTLTYEKT